MKPRVGMILAAGLGTRLRPITNAIPKALVPVGGRPMIEFPLRALVATGVERVVVNLHHLGDAIRETLGDGRRFGVEIVYSPENPILDTGGAVVRARDLLGEREFFLWNCDAIVDPDLDALTRRHDTSGALATLLLREDADAARFGLVEIDGEDRVRRFLGRAAPGAEHEALAPRMFCGVHVLSPRVFERLPPGGVFSITRDVYAPWTAEGVAISAVTYRGYWRDLGTPGSLAAADADLAAGRFRPAFLE